MYATPKCQDCKFFKPRVVESLDGNEEEKGECRRNPPVFFHESKPDGRMHGFTHFPILRDIDWCGEFKARNDW